MLWSVFQRPTHFPLGQSNSSPSTTNHLMRSKSPVSPEHARVFSNQARYCGGALIEWSPAGSNDEQPASASSARPSANDRRGSVPPDICLLIVLREHRRLGGKRPRT